ncbi:MAG TPA: DNA methyltransferase [Ktedonobacteraceae bacterium]|nr:DNA methyltransferase [Ktedonobacteraceae bacterium]
MSEEETQDQDVQRYMRPMQGALTVAEGTGGPITCLGLSFASDSERRAYFTERLREKLADPTFRTQEGFPIGSDEDILALSDPPYYTACPNPFLADFERCFNTPYDASVPYRREPLAVDVSEGRTDSIYTAHSYHTKVPHKAIMRYIMHYTQPGDIVLDGFCGSGMTGVAAQACANPEGEYKIQIESEWTQAGRGLPEWGRRYSILNDLSPSATFIAYNYNTSVDGKLFEQAANALLSRFEATYGWMYKTGHSDGKCEGRINYVIWSDVFVCAVCNREIIFWDAAVHNGEVQDTTTCPHCDAKMSKDALDRASIAIFDPTLNQTISKAKRVPVLINYTVGGKRFEKRPDSADLELLDRIEREPIPGWYPTRRIDEDIDLWYERDYRSLGIFSIDAFFFRRNMIMVSYFKAEIEKTGGRLQGFLWFWFQSVLMGFSLLNRYRAKGFSQVNQLLSGTLYIGAILAEVSPWYALTGKISRLQAIARMADSGVIVSTSSTTQMAIPDDSIDYIFTDPPFGSNIIYSDLSILWESWLRISTNTDQEAVVHRRKRRGASRLADYQQLMTSCFAEMHRVLKPGRWITIEFHNTKNAVWAAIQESLLHAGFVIADVRTLDKQMGTFKQVTTASAVKQDLVISAYKPTGELKDRFKLDAGTEEGVWDFMRTHLRQLPVFIPTQDGRAEVIAERLDYLLFDRMVAFHVQRGVAVPLSAPEFYAGLRQRFPQRDEMFFLEEQVAEYERKRLSVREIQQLTIFVKDESTAIQWLRQQLANKPQTQAELTPQFMRELGAWDRHEKLPEMIELLEQNFLRYDGEGPVPAQIVGWMRKSSELRELIEQKIAAGMLRADGGLDTRESRLLTQARDRWYVPDPYKAIDLEKLRTRALLREFATYAEGRGKLKLFRTEAVRAGFAAAWRERDYLTITRIAERLPESVLQEDPDLLMYYDTASLHVRP